MHALALALLLNAAPPGIDLEGMDTTVAPGDDFNAYCSGTWLKGHEIPADRASFGVGGILNEQTSQRTRALLETTTDAQISTFYKTFMDEAAIEKLGFTPLKPELTAIAGIADKSALAAALGKTLRADTDALNLSNFSTPHLFGLWVVQALDDPQHNTPYLMQGGLGMPDREYYVSSADDMVALRKKYQVYVAQLLKLAALTEPDAKAARVVALELKIAQAHATRADSEKIENAASWKKDALAKVAPGLDWDAFLKGAQLDAPRFYAWQPKAIVALSALVASEPLDAWKDWLTFHAIDDAAPYLSKAFVDAHFEFQRKALLGIPQQSERAKRAVAATNDALGHAVGKIYVAKYFPPEAKKAAQEMVNATLKAFVKRIDALKWMSPKTRNAAKDKVAALRVGVGYPDTWRDYSGLKIVAGDLLGNVERAELYDYQRTIAKIGKAVDRDEWWMLPQEVDAVNLPLQNAIQFPAGILQAPLFDLAADPAANYGGTASAIGHEISHSFDDQGAKVDALGRYVNWWTPEDLKHFQAAGEKLATQFDEYEALPGLHLNGHQELGENIADVAGLAAAYDAYKETVRPKPGVKVQGFTGEQLFFIAYGQGWREKLRDEALKSQIIGDGHAPPAYRAQTARNLDAWYTAFGVKAGQKLFLKPADRVRVW